MSEASYDGPSYVLHLSVEGQCLVVLQTGRLQSVADAERVQQLVAKHCARHGLSRLVIDNRQTEAPDPSVLDVMRAWIHSGQFEAVGFVLESELLRVGVNMDALQKGRRVRAFGDANAALKWAERYRPAAHGDRVPSSRPSGRAKA